MNKSNIRFLSLASMSLFVALAPLACGSDDDDTNNGTAGTTSTGGKAGASSSAGKSGGGTNSSGGSVNPQGGDIGVVGGSEAGGAGGEGGVAEAPKARLRVVHASPNAPSVDIYPKGSATAAVKNVGYGQATDFMEVDAGTVAFDLRAAGAKATTAAAVTTGDITVDGGADYTLVAAGDFANLDDADTGFRVLALEHDFDAPAAGTAVARVVHATSAWDTVDLDVIGTDDVDLPGLKRFDSESNVVLPAAAVIDVDFQNADGVLSKLTVPKLTAKSELFVIATGNPGFPFRAPANGFALLVVDQDSKVSWVKEQPWLHLVNASDIGTVDIYESKHTAAGDKLTDNLAVSTMAGFQLPTSEAGFTVDAVAGTAANGTATAIATGVTSTLEAGEHYLSFIAGGAIGTIHEQFDLLQPTKVLLRGVHASASSAQTVDFGAVTGAALSSVLIAEVKPGEASLDAGVAVAPGNVTLGASPHSLTTLLAQKAFTGTAAPVAGERDFVVLTAGAEGISLVDTAVAGWSLR